MPTLPHIARKLGLAHVVRHGWTVIGVPAEDEAAATWVYTTGLWHSFSCPELVVCGLPVQLGMQVLNVVGERARHGQPPRPEERSAEVLEGLPVTFRRVQVSWYRWLLGWMGWFYWHRRQLVPVLQVVWPDGHGRFPWDVGFDPRYQDHQPELWRPAGDQAAGCWQQLQEVLRRPFGLAADAGVFTTKRILAGTAEILGVVHDNDGDWQFLDGGPTQAEDGALVHLQHLIDRDRSILDVDDLRCGWQAWRPSPTAPWQRQPLPDPSDGAGTACGQL